MKSGDRKTAQKQADKVKNNLGEAAEPGKNPGKPTREVAKAYRDQMKLDGAVSFEKWGYGFLVTVPKDKWETFKAKYGPGKNISVLSAYNVVQLYYYPGHEYVPLDYTRKMAMQSKTQKTEGIGDKIKQGVDNVKLVGKAYQAAKSCDIDNMPTMDMSKVPQGARNVPGIPNMLDDMIGKGLWKLLGVAAKKEGNAYVFRGMNGPIDDKILQRAQAAVDQLGMSVEISGDKTEMRVSERVQEGIMDWARGKVDNAVKKDPSRRSIPGLSTKVDDFIWKDRSQYDGN